VILTRGGDKDYGGDGDMGLIPTPSRSLARLVVECVTPDAGFISKKVGRADLQRFFRSRLPVCPE
jgi:hypothetical protein